ncbi:MAG TPA: homoserine dehydrogenase [Myxococcales bacterium]|nr:homoserine dehydrogenase [Myxococcales bacterium]HIK84571.1 homoserine dehydrogenase [Myxococcales bacterium]
MSGQDEQKPIGVGLIGFGTIGTGVVKVLRDNAEVIEQRLGSRLRLVRIADLDLDTDRGVDLSGIVFDADASALIADPDVQIVIELIGGYDVPRKFILEAFAAGKHVVTANKALLALHGREIFGAAASASVEVAFEAAVGGGIPVLRSLREGLAANQIETVLGILNGTTNYVLTEMESTGEDFDVVLKRAQELGYAEADPTFDVEGIDAAHKLALMTTMAFGAEITFEDIPTTGIRGLLPIDFELAAQFGYRIKLLGIAKCHRSEDGQERIEARVQPTLVRDSSLLAKVDGAMNAVLVIGNAVGPTLYYGAGAGEMPTASAVVGDLMEIAREIRRGGSGPVPPLSYFPEQIGPKPFVPDAELSGRHYLRISVKDQPGLLGRVTSLLGDEAVAVETAMVRSANGSDSIILLTGVAAEDGMQRAIVRIVELDEVTEMPRVIRIEEEA